MMGVSSFVVMGSRPVVKPCLLQEPSSPAHVSMLAGALDRVLDFARLMSSVSIDVTSGRKGDTLAAALQHSVAAVPSACELGTCGSAGLLLARGVRDVAGAALRPLDASRIAFPDHAAEWRIGKWMPDEVWEPFEQPRLLRLDAPPRPPTASVRGSRRVWEKVVERVAEAEGLEFCDESEIPRDAEGRPLKAGYFAIYKDEAKDRTITNAIPANSQEETLGLAQKLLARCVSLGEIVLRPLEKLRGSGRDLPDAYHSARVPLERAFRNAVGPWMEGHRWAHTAAFRRLVERRKERGLTTAPRRITACWRSLPMGDLNAVDFMQVSHINCLRARGCCSDDSLVTYRRPLPPGSEGVWEGIVVDDYNVIATVPVGLQPSEPAADTARLAQADRAYAEEGREPKPSKCFDHEALFHVWGGTIDGDRGSAQAGAELMGRLSLLCLRLLYSGACSVGFWRAVVGLLSYVAFVGGRTAFALFDAVYVETVDRDVGDVIQPSSRARAEIESLLALLPMIFVDLRAEVSPVLYATDASSLSAAIVSTEIEPTAARELWRFRYRKGANTQLRTLAEQMVDRFKTRTLALAEARRILGTENPGDDEGPAEDEAPAWSAALADSVGCRQEWHGPVKRRQHINCKEAKPLQLLTCRLARDAGAHRKKHMVLVDSSVNVASWSKGRSRSRALNAFLKRAAPEALMARLSLGFAHIRSAFNPSDDPTRGRPVRTRPRRHPDPASLMGRFLCAEPLSFEEMGELFGVDVRLPSAVFDLGQEPNPRVPEY